MHQEKVIHPSFIPMPMLLSSPIYQVDAFTDVPFKGNPAGVVLLGEPMEVALMQQIALEMNVSETAFVLPCDDFFQIRYFTPTREVPLCGHATLAASHVLFESGAADICSELYLKAEGADLTIRKTSDGIAMNFPVYPLSLLAVPDCFEEIIGFRPVELYSSLYDWVVAVAASEDEVARAVPQFSRMQAAGLGHLMITAPAETNGFDFVLRCFAPVSGIDEDPVTGSAHCALTPYWASRLDKTVLHSLQLSRRTDRLKTVLLDRRIDIIGEAVTVFTIEMTF